MPTVLRSGGFRLFFYANEGNPREPPHIHVDRGEFEAKFWLRPEVAVAYNDGFNARVLNEVVRLIEANREEIERAWRQFFR
jgi:Domain of unknown function (DUF4160)